MNGKGREFSKAQLLADTGRADLVFTHQEDTRQSVHVWGDTATVTALLHVAGTDHGQAFAFEPAFPAHHLMHGANKFGLASLTNLDKLPPTGALLITPPLKIEKGSGSPLRVLALVPA